MDENSRDVILIELVIPGPIYWLIGVRYGADAAPPAIPGDVFVIGVDSRAVIAVIRNGPPVSIRKLKTQLSFGQP